MVDVAAEVVEAERKRCVALAAGDHEALRQLLASDLVHIHATGVAEDREAYFAGLTDRLRFYHAERISYDVRVLGETAAVANGIIEQGLQVRASGEDLMKKFITTQVWRKTDGHWTQASFHASMLAL